MYYEYLQGKCLECNEEKPVFVPRGKEPIEGICYECVIKLKNKK